MFKLADAIAVVAARALPPRPLAQSIGEHHSAEGEARKKEFRRVFPQQSQARRDVFGERSVHLLPAL